MAHFTTMKFSELLKYCDGSFDEVQRHTGWSRELCERYAAGEEPSMYHHMQLGLIGMALHRSENPSE